MWQQEYNYRRLKNALSTTKINEKNSKKAILLSNKNNSDFTPDVV